MLNKNFKIPNRRKLSDLASEYYAIKKSKLKEELSVPLKVSLTSDSWTSNQNFSYLSLTAHYLDKNFSVISKCLSIKHLIGSHNLSNIAENIR